VGKPTRVNIRGLRGEQRAKEIEGLDLSRELILAIDPARDFPKALICDYFGTVLENPFLYCKFRRHIYFTSYSRRSKYYTLDEIARFTELGLRSFDTAWFSKHGTLVKTVEVLVEVSESGHYAEELECILKVSVKDALRKLYE